MNDVIFRYDLRLVNELLYMEDDWEIISARIDKEHVPGVLVLVVRHKGFPCTPDLSALPEGVIIVKSKVVVDKLEVRVT